MLSSWCASVLCRKARQSLPAGRDVSRTVKLHHHHHHQLIGKKVYNLRLRRACRLSAQSVVSRLFVVPVDCADSERRGGREGALSPRLECTHGWLRVREVAMAARELPLVPSFPALRWAFVVLLRAVNRRGLGAGKLSRWPSPPVTPAFRLSSVFMLTCDSLTILATSSRCPRNPFRRCVSCR